MQRISRWRFYAANKHHFVKPILLPAEERSFSSSRLPRTIPHSLEPDSDTTDAESVSSVHPNVKPRVECVPVKCLTSQFLPADLLPPSIPESNRLHDKEYCYYRARLDYIEAKHYSVLYDNSKPWQGRTTSVMISHLLHLAWRLLLVSLEQSPYIFGVCRPWWRRSQRSRLLDTYSSVSLSSSLCL
jgi:hypothetical protein